MNDDQILQAKTQLANIIAETVRATHPMAETIANLGLEQERAAQLLCCNAEGFILDELFRILNKLGLDVIITIVRAQENRPGCIRVARATEV